MFYFYSFFLLLFFFLKTIPYKLLEGLFSVTHRCWVRKTVKMKLWLAFAVLTQDTSQRALPQKEACVTFLIPLEKAVMGKTINFIIKGLQTYIGLKINYFLGLTWLLYCL